MSSLDTAINTIPAETMPERKLKRKQDVQKSTLFDKLQIKKHLAQRKLNKAWYWRNYDHGEVFTASLEIDCVSFQQNIFVEDTNEIASKLLRLGYEIQETYPNSGFFNNFSRVMYNKKYNIAIHLYKKAYSQAIHTANEIVNKSEIDGDTGMSVFLATVNTLMQSK